MTHRTIRLELLREGPPHNQLLSPLTRYLALCNNRAPEAFRLEIEHADFLRWQPNFDSPLGDGLRQARVEVTRILGSIRSLAAELSGGAPTDWNHVHLVLSAAELASMPFEIALAAPGMPGEGQPLFLQAEHPITLTRESRRQSTSTLRWPESPRILLAAASPNGFKRVPLDAHELALCHSIDPWIGWTDPTDALKEALSASSSEAFESLKQKIVRARAGEAQEMLTVLPNATFDEISVECRRTSYTHVHILAHGAELPEEVPGQKLYGIALNGRDGEADVVDGRRLEIALRGSDQTGGPAVVTLATCESGNMVGGVIGPGAAVAHQLHERGVPLVVASQFPLTYPGSAVLAETLYSGILRGEDPRGVIHSVRRRLFQRLGDRTNDWASVVAYGSLPADFDRRLRATQVRRCGLAMDAAVARVHVHAILDVSLDISVDPTLRQELGTREGLPLASEHDWPPPATSREVKEARLELDGAWQRLDDEYNHLEAIRGRCDYAETGRFGSRPDEWRDATRRMASALLRAHDMFRHTCTRPRPVPTHDQVAARALSRMGPQEILQQTIRCYRELYTDTREYWPLVQSMTLEWAAGEGRRLPKLEEWRTAWTLALQIQLLGSAGERALARACLAELVLLWLVMPSRPDALPEVLAQMRPPQTEPPKSEDEFVFVARVVCGSLLERMVHDVPHEYKSFRAFAALRQARRFCLWAPVNEAKSVRTVATAMVEQFTRHGTPTYWGPL